MKKNNSKYFYTAQLMNQALLELLEKKDLEFISVTEITKKAGVYRSTFYLHYENIYELFEETIENINKNFLQSMQGNIPSMDSKDTSFLMTSQYLIPYLDFVKKNRKILKLIHQRPHLFKVEATYKKMYQQYFYPAIANFIKDESKRVFLLEFYTRGVSGIINKWLDLDCNLAINDLIKIIKDCVGYTQE